MQTLLGAIEHSVQTLLDSVMVTDKLDNRKLDNIYAANLIYIIIFMKKTSHVQTALHL